MSSISVEPEIADPPLCRAARRRTVPATAASVAGAEVLGLDAAGTLGFLIEQRRVADRAAAQELAAVAHWAELHRVDTSREVGAVDPEVLRVLEEPGVAQTVTAETAAAASTLDLGGGVLGREGALRLAGEGAFAVAEFAVTEVAAGLGMSEPAARAYVGQALELRDRLPRCWGQVMAGRLPAWRARRIAAETISLNADAAGLVDTALTPFAATLSVTRVLRAVDAAITRHDPALAADRARAAAEHRGVWTHDQLDGTTRIEAVTGTPDATAFDTAVSDVAATLAALGDPDGLQVRRAKAVGVLADPQYALDLAATADEAQVEEQQDVVLPRRRAGHSGTRPVPTLHIHLHTAASDSVPAGRPSSLVEAVARVTGGGATSGARSIAVVEQWLRDLSPGTAVTVTPVVDLTAWYAVNAYEVPDRLRAQVEHRDEGCRFPWCGRTGRYDLDHVVPYRWAGAGPDAPNEACDPDEPQPPPGQTSTDNLARLCRFHHRVKTHAGWTYRRDHPDPDEPQASVLRRTSPLGRRYTTDETGTYPER